MSESTTVATADTTLPDFAAFEAAENRKALGEAEPAPVEAPAADPEADEQDEPEAPAESPAPIVEAKSEAKSESTPEKPVGKRQQHINDLERKAKLAEIRAEELATKIAALEAKATPADVTPEPAAAAIDPEDLEPQEGTFLTYPEFMRALARWEIRQDRRDAEAATAKAKADEQRVAQAEDFKARVSTFVGRRNAFLAKHPDRAERVGAFLDTVRAGTPIGDALMESDVCGELSDYFATHPTEAERIARLSPISALRALGKLESLFAPLTHASALAQPAAKTVTTAPAPPTTLSARSASVADVSRAAVERGDFSAFAAEENRKALAATR